MKSLKKRTWRDCFKILENAEDNNESQGILNEENKFSDRRLLNLPRINRNKDQFGHCITEIDDSKSAKNDLLMNWRCGKTCSLKWGEPHLDIPDPIEESRLTFNLTDHFDNIEMENHIYEFIREAPEKKNWSCKEFEITWYFQNHIWEAWSHKNRLKEAHLLYQTIYKIHDGVPTRKISAEIRDGSDWFDKKEHINNFLKDFMGLMKTYAVSLDPQKDPFPFLAWLSNSYMINIDFSNKELVSEIKHHMQAFYDFNITDDDRAVWINSVRMFNISQNMQLFKNFVTILRGFSLIDIIFVFENDVIEEGQFYEIINWCTSLNNKDVCFLEAILKLDLILNFGPQIEKMLTFIKWTFLVKEEFLIEKEKDFIFDAINIYEWYALLDQPENWRWDNLEAIKIAWANISLKFKKEEEENCLAPSVIWSTLNSRKLYWKELDSKDCQRINCQAKWTFDSAYKFNAHFGKIIFSPLVFRITNKILCMSDLLYLLAVSKSDSVIVVDDSKIIISLDEEFSSILPAKEFEVKQLSLLKTSFLLSTSKRTFCQSWPLPSLIALKKFISHISCLPIRLNLRSLQLYTLAWVIKLTWIPPERYISEFPSLWKSISVVYRSTFFKSHKLVSLKMSPSLNMFTPEELSTIIKTQKKHWVYLSTDKIFLWSWYLTSEFLESILRISKKVVLIEWVVQGKDMETDERLEIYGGSWK
jgi:hypothetical protein